MISGKTCVNNCADSAYFYNVTQIKATPNMLCLSSCPTTNYQAVDLNYKNNTNATRCEASCDLMVDTPYHSNLSGINTIPQCVANCHN